MSTVKNGCWGVLALSFPINNCSAGELESLSLQGGAQAAEGEGLKNNHNSHHVYGVGKWHRVPLNSHRRLGLIPGGTQHRSPSSESESFSHLVPLPDVSECWMLFLGHV